MPSPEEPFSPPSYQPESTKSRVPAWLPLAAFAGTTVALAIPLVFLARSRNAVLRKFLNESTAAPPKRMIHNSSTDQFQGGSTFKFRTSESKSSTTEVASASTSDLLSAMSRVDFSTAMYAGKAFAIATGIVTVGGVALTMGVKFIMGVRDTKDFADRMRIVVRKALPGLTSQIHRPPETAEEGAQPFESPEAALTWNWEDAEKRLQASYEEGGFPTWLQTALKEAEAELYVERARRQKDYQNVDQKELPTPPPR